MTSRKLDELASDIDDASMVVEELQDDPDTDSDEKLEDLHHTLEHASDTIDEIDNKESKHQSSITATRPIVGSERDKTGKER